MELDVNNRKEKQQQQQSHRNGALCVSDIFVVLRVSATEPSNIGSRVTSFELLFG